MQRSSGPSSKNAERITRERITIWQRYHQMLAPLEQQGLLRRPIVPAECQHNGHMYYVLLSPEIDRQKVLDELKKRAIHAVCFTIFPLHSSPAGRALRARAWRPFVDDVVVAAPDPAADVAGFERGSATPDMRDIARYLEAVSAALRDGARLRGRPTPRSSVSNGGEKAQRTCCRRRLPARPVRVRPDRRRHPRRRPDASGQEPRCGRPP